MITTLFVAAALAGDPPKDAAASDSDWGLQLAGGLGAAAGPPSVQGHVVGRLVLDLGRVGLSLGGREGVATQDLRTVGGVFAGLQGELGKGFLLRGGFAHHHETPWEAFKRAPVGAFAGVSEGIRHRSGLEVGAGYQTGLGEALGLGPWLGIGWDLSAAVFPDPSGPPVYMAFDQHFTVRVR